MSGSSPQHPHAPEPMSVSEAKTRLLLYGEAQSLKAEIGIARVKEQVRRLTPWAAGSAGLLGLLTAWGRGRPRREKPRAASAAKVPSTPGHALAGWAIRSALPIALKMFARWRARRAKRQEQQVEDEGGV